MLRLKASIINTSLLLFFVGSLFAWPASADVTAESGLRPNILFIFTDDQPQSCLSCLSESPLETPNLDRLARTGVHFTNAFTTTAICCSNRACILTGQHMRRHGIEDFKTPLSAEAFSQTYPALLRQHGYRTGYLGKYAVGRPDKEIRSLSLPKDQFDFWYGFPQSINFLQTEANEPKYLTTGIEEAAETFLANQPEEQPFCLTVALKEPHGPWNYFDPELGDAYADVEVQLPPTFTTENYRALPDFIRQSLGGKGGEERLADPQSLIERTRIYYRLIARADLAVGRILASLNQHGFDKNTVVIFSSDHGSMLGSHGLTGKWLMYEESIRVPLIVYDPRLASSQTNRRVGEMALSIDLAPTMLAIAGVKIPDSMQGQNLMPLVEGSSDGADWRKEWYYEHTYTDAPLRPIPKSEGVRTESWKYVRYTEVTPHYEQLFHIEADPHEQFNLANDSQYTETLTQLRTRCDALRRELK